MVWGIIVLPLGMILIQILLYCPIVYFITGKQVYTKLQCWLHYASRIELILLLCAYCAYCIGLVIYCSTLDLHVQCNTCCIQSFQCFTANSHCHIKLQTTGSYKVNNLTNHLNSYTKIIFTCLCRLRIEQVSPVSHKNTNYGWLNHLHIWLIMLT